MNEPTMVHVAVLLGTVRHERRSEQVARWLSGLISEREDTTSELIDLREIDLTLDHAGRARQILRLPRPLTAPMGWRS